MTDKRSVLVRRAMWVLAACLVAGAACNLPAGWQSRFGKATATTLPTSTPAPTLTPQPLPPAVIETRPERGSRVALSGEVTLYFNQEMDRSSVQRALSMDPDVDAQLQWIDPATLQVVPESKLAPASSLTLTVETSAVAANGLALREPLQMTYTTPDFLRPSDFLPAPGSSEIDTNAAIVVTFNQPVVPLGEGSADAPPGFSLQPDVPGSGEWINTSTYRFTPRPALAGGVTYTAQLNPALTGTTGAPLQEDSQQSWSFSTTSPVLVSREPGTMAQQVPLNAPLVLTFNQAMDRESLQAHLALRDNQGRAVPGRVEMSEDLKTAKFIPASLLMRDTNYTALVPAETQTAGGTPLATDISWRFKTVGPLKLLESNPRQGFSTTVYQGVLLYFNSPLDLEDIEEHISVTPEISNLRISWVDADNALRITGDFGALENYTLIISESLTDLWGSSLTRPIGLSFNTKAFAPNLLISQGPNDLFLTGSENVIPVQGTNLATVRISLGTIPPDRYADVLGPERYQALNNYTPDDNRSWGKTVNIPGDASYRFDLPLTPDGTTLSPGLYRYQVSSPQLPYDPAPYLIAVSDHHLALKVSPQDLLAWVVALESGDPAAQQPIRIYDQDGRPVFSGETDAQGTFRAEFNTPRDLYDDAFYAVVGSPGEESFAVSSSRWQQGLEPYLFNLSADYGYQDSTTYIYTDRPIYRPGQTVHFRLVHRGLGPNGYILPEEDELETTVFSPQGELDKMNLSLSSYGTAHGQYTLSEFAEPGYYRFETSAGLASFQVAEYRKPEINLDVKLSPDRAVVGEVLQAEVDARYYFDAPAGDIALDWSLRARRAPFHLPGYQVGLLDSGLLGMQLPYMGFGTGVDAGQGQTTRAGKFTRNFEIPGDVDGSSPVSHPAMYTFEVTVQDESGFPVSARAETRVHPSRFYIGVNPGAWISRAGERAQFDIKVVDWEKQPDGVRELRAEFNKVTWSGTASAPSHTSARRELNMLEGTDVQTDQDGTARVSFTPPEPGTYQLNVFGEGARTEILVWVRGEGQPTWPALSNQRLSLIADQDSYQPGEEAQVFIPNPFPEGAQALVTLERDRIHYTSSIVVDGAGETIDLPLTGREAPNVYLSVTMLGTDEQGRPDFRQGYINLPVSPEEDLLQVEIMGDPRRTSPAGEVSFNIRVTDHNGQPVQGEFSLAVVDEAVLALADASGPGITEAFYGTRELAVRLGLPLSLYAGRDIIGPGGIGGGGGGGPAMLPVRSKFEDTAYWNAAVTTDARGEATVTVTLPDNLTTWQALIRGTTTDTKVGEAKTEVITSKPLLVRAVTPRFLVAGDHLQLAAIVHNQTEQALDTEVTLQANGVILDQPSLSTQAVTVAAGERAVIDWWVEVEDKQAADLIFTAQADQYQDAVKPEQGSLPILRYTASRTYSTAGMLDESGARLEVVDLPRTFDPSSGSLEVELSPSLGAALSQALDALSQEDHESAVGAMSQLLPNLAAYKALQELALEKPELQRRLDEELPGMLDRITAMQNDDGGWGWWSGDDSSRVITSYLLFGLSQAQDAGVFVDSDVKQLAVEYLRATLPSTDMLTRSWQFDELAFQYFALHEAGGGELSGVGNLYNHRQQLSPWGKALLAIVLQEQAVDDPRVATLFSNLEATAVRSASGAHWEEEECLCRLTSTGTTSAIVTYALARHGAGSGTLPQAVRYLMSIRQPRGDWRSNYETSWSILALSEVMKASAELEADFSFQASLNGKEMISGQAGKTLPLSSVSASSPVRELLPDHPNALEIERGEGQGRLYYRSHLRVSRPAADVSPYSSGMSLSRAYSFFEDQDDLTYTQHGSTNELIRVHLTLTLENDTHYLKVRDMIPSGAEILDTRLKTTQQAEAVYDVSTPFREGWGWWFFNPPQVYDDHIIWSSSFLPAGTYQLTYTLALNIPGEYQVLPARAWQTYFPDIQANSAGDEFIIAAAQE